MITFILKFLFLEFAYSIYIVILIINPPLLYIIEKYSYLNNLDNKLSSLNSFILLISYY